MKNKLLELYNKYVWAEKPDINTIRSEFSLPSSSLPDILKILNDIKSISLEDLTKITIPDNSVSGRKAIYIPNKFFSSFVNYFPWETFALNYNSPIIGMATVWSIEDKLKCDLREVPKVYTGTENLWNIIIPTLSELIKTQEWYGFNLGDPYNKRRKRPIVRRKIEILEVQIDKYSSYYGRYSNINAYGIDVKTGQNLCLIGSNGWNLYLSEEIMNQRLEDLENYWMRGYDEKVRSLEIQIQNKESEIKNLKEERKRMMNSIDEYKKELDKIVWKDF